MKHYSLLIGLYEAGKYSVDALGNIYSHTSRQGKITETKTRLKPINTTRGYYQVHLSGPNRFTFKVYVHQAVYFYFHRKSIAGHHINHIDFDKSNNSISNLEMISPKENHHHSRKAGRMKNVRGAEVYGVKLTEKDVLLIRNLCKKGLNQRYIAKNFDVSPSTVCMVKHKKVWKHI